MIGFRRAEFPTPHTILGLRLLPLTLGHYSLFEFLELAWVTGGDVEWNDLALGVAICAVPFAEAKRMIYDPGTERVLRDWAERLTRTRKVDMLLRRKPTPIDFVSKCKAFREYLSEHLWTPTYYAERDGTALDLPRSYILKIQLMREFGWSDEQVDNRPIAKCLCDMTALRALDGSINLMPEEMQNLDHGIPIDDEVFKRFCG